VLRKKGYKDHKLTVQPDANREYEAPLIAARHGSTGRSSPVAPPKPAAEDATQAKPDKAPVKHIGDLKNPFGD
jgi:hypothetical protein